jgi:hypothetical protein
MMFRNIRSKRVGKYLGLIGFVATATLASAPISERLSNTAVRGKTPPSVRAAMINVLGVPNPNPALGEEAQTLNRLVGTWDADFTFPKPDGTVSRKKGELHFGWVIDGYAVQDLWIGYPTGVQKERTIGTTLWFFDSKLKQWRIVFINPQSGDVVTMQGGREGDRIVLRGVGTDGLPTRYTFRDITPASFRWQGEKSHDGGQTWALEEDNHMRKRSG